MIRLRLGVRVRVKVRLGVRLGVRVLPADFDDIEIKAADLAALVRSRYFGYFKIGRMAMGRRPFEAVTRQFKKRAAP